MCGLKTGSVCLFAKKRTTKMSQTVSDGQYSNKLFVLCDCVSDLDRDDNHRFKL